MVVVYLMSVCIVMYYTKHINNFKKLKYICHHKPLEEKYHIVIDNK